MLGQKPIWVFVCLFIVFLFIGCKGKTSTPVSQKSTKPEAQMQKDSTDLQPPLWVDIEELAASGASAEELLGIITNELTRYEEEESTLNAKELRLKAELANVLSNRTRLQEDKARAMRALREAEEKIELAEAKKLQEEQALAEQQRLEAEAEQAGGDVALATNARQVTKSGPQGKVSAENAEKQADPEPETSGAMDEVAQLDASAPKGAETMDEPEPETADAMEEPEPETADAMDEVAQLDASSASIDDSALPENPAAQDLSISSTADSIDLSWDDESDKGAAAYSIYRDGVFMKSLSGTSYTEDKLKSETTYCYSVKAVDANGMVLSEKKDACTQTLVADSTPPETPLEVLLRVLSENSIALSWKPSSDNIGVEGYNVYFESNIVATIMDEAAVTMEELLPETEYCYLITAFDASRNESSPSKVACGKTPYKDVKRPVSPGSVIISERENNFIDLSWGESSDDVGVVGYNIYQDGVFLKGIASTSVFDVKVNDEETHCFSISALDASGNESRRSRQVCVTKMTVSADGEKSLGGTVWTSGTNKYGQLGDGTTKDHSILMMINDQYGVASVASGYEHTLALKMDGTVLAWGRNNYGQLGDGTTVDRSKPVRVKGLTEIIDISVGWSHSLALRADGTVWSWGYNSKGQLGIRKSGMFKKPVKIKKLKDIISIAAGGWHSAAVSADGTVWSWGWNNKGQLGDGTLKTWFSPVKLKVLSDVEIVSVGMYHTLALKSDGTVWSWGYNKSGQLGQGHTSQISVPGRVPGLKDIVSVTAGIDHSIALKRNGNIWSWGSNKYGQTGLYDEINIVLSPKMIKEIDNVEMVISGSYHSVALRRDGTVWAWGMKYSKRYKNDYNPTLISGLKGVVHISAGYQFSIAVKGR